MSVCLYVYVYMCVFVCPSFCFHFFLENIDPSCDVLCHYTFPELSLVFRALFTMSCGLRAADSESGMVLFAVSVLVAKHMVLLSLSAS